MDRRGRLTLADLAEATVVIAFVGGLASVFFTSLDGAAPYLSPGEAYLWQLVYPLMAVVLLLAIWRKATVGGGV